MDITKFKPLFGDWFPLMEKFLILPEFAKIMEDLRARTARGKIIFPYSSTLKSKCKDWKDPKNNIFDCFRQTPIDKLKVIFVGLSPYFTIQNGVPIADGLAFSTKQKDNPSSLKALYDGIEHDFFNGLNLNMARESNLEFLAEQGVLLLNAALTCEPSMPTIHLDLWKPFMTYFFNMLNKEFSNLHIVFWGDEAQQYAKLVHEQKSEAFPFPNQHYIYKENHPSYFAKTSEIMKTDIFSTINKRLDVDGKYFIAWDKVMLEEPPF